VASPPEDDIRVRFPRRVRECRRVLGISQEELAERCGLDRTYVSGIERGRRNVSLWDNEEMARGLGLTLSERVSPL